MAELNGILDPVEWERTNWKSWRNNKMENISSSDIQRIEWENLYTSKGWEQNEERQKFKDMIQFSSVAATELSNSLRPHESQHARLPCPSPTPRVHSDSRLMPSSHLILCRPLLLLPPIPPSIRVFSNEATLRMKWPKCWSFSFSIIPSKEHPGLISFRMDWLDLLAVQLLDMEIENPHHICSYLLHLPWKQDWVKKFWCLEKS